MHASHVLRQDDLVKHSFARLEHAFDVGATHAAAIHAAKLRANFIERARAFVERALQSLEAHVVTNTAVDFDA